VINKPFGEIAERDLQELINSGVPEGRNIDYKQQLPGTNDADKKEFLADITSFANTAGGDLIFGVSETQGLPTSILGLGVIDQDLELQRLDSVIQSGIEPRIRYHSRFVSSSVGPVLLIRIEKSWNSPHRVIFKGHDKFYARNSTGKYPLDTSQLRTAFNLSQSVNDRIKSFRIDRIIEIQANRTPLPLPTGAKMILHCMPVEAFASPSEVDFLQYTKSPQLFPPIAAGGWNHRINLDGLVSYNPSGDGVLSYTQLYRTGIIEAVEARLLNHTHEGRRMIPSVSYEEQLLEYIPICLGIFSRLKLNPPIVVALTLVGVAGLIMGTSFFDFSIKEPIDRETLMLPETIVHDLNTPAVQVLKPIFDMVWNACGRAGSPNFDQNGNWVPRR